MTSDAENRQVATIYSVASRASVSIATVSRVLHGSSTVSEATRAKVMAVMEELDYLPSGAARSLAVRRHATFGLVLPELGGPYYAELLVGFETRAAELDQSVMVVLAGTKDDRGRAVQNLATRVDGIALFGADTASGITERSRPVVIVAGHARPGMEAIGTENLSTAEALAGHVLDHGRTHLRFLGDTSAAADVLERYQGFCAAHRARGLEPPAGVPMEPRESHGAAFAERLLAGQVEADALVCANDELALAAMARLLDGGVDVPGDIAVVGWDDVMTARYVRPGLTTVRQPVGELGALAADRLHHLVSGMAPRLERQVLPTELVIRGSCGCPP